MVETTRVVNHHMPPSPLLSPRIRIRPVQLRRRTRRRMATVRRIASPLRMMTQVEPLVHPRVAPLTRTATTPTTTTGRGNMSPATVLHKQQLPRLPPHLPRPHPPQPLLKRRSRTDLHLRSFMHPEAAEIVSVEVRYHHEDDRAPVNTDDARDEAEHRHRPRLLLSQSVMTRR